MFYDYIQQRTGRSYHYYTTVLFFFRIVKSKIGYLYVGGQTAPVHTIKYTKMLKDMDDKIIECKFENNRWVFMRERTDKSFPNSYATAKGIFLLFMETTHIKQTNLFL